MKKQEYNYILVLSKKYKPKEDPDKGEQRMYGMEGFSRDESMIHASHMDSIDLNADEMIQLLILIAKIRQQRRIKH